MTLGFGQGDTFLMGSPGGKTKHLWIVLSDKAKHSGHVLAVNLTTDSARAGGECELNCGDHVWITEKSWVSFGDAKVFDLEKDAGLFSSGVNQGWIVPHSTMDTSMLARIVAAAKLSRAFPPVYLKFLD